MNDINFIFSVLTRQFSEFQSNSCRNMKHRLLTAFTLALLASCSPDNVTPTTSSDLGGKWIEVSTTTDTLTFESWGNLEVMTLSRGKEMQNGHMLPKTGSGPYEYKLTQEKISLYWMLSSNYSFKEYSFIRNGNRIIVDNFYDPGLGDRLIFEKLN